MYVISFSTHLNSHSFCDPAIVSQRELFSKVEACSQQYRKSAVYLVNLKMKLHMYMGSALCIHQWHCQQVYCRLLPGKKTVKEFYGVSFLLLQQARDGNVASRSVKDIIKKHLMMPKNRDLLEGDEPEAGFRYGLDGRPQAKNNIIGTVVACITPVRNPEQALARPKRTVREEYCVFLYSGKEDYEEQVRCGSRVFREIEEHLNGIDIDLGEERKKHVKIKW
ncbi:uncharacterized protein LOC144915009 [Branchiostoma floridae x Branchiostoma belcheri]